MDIESRILSLGLTLPKPPLPVAKYVPAVRSGSLLFTSGLLPMAEGRLVHSGKLGEGLSVEQGQAAARVAVLNGLSILKQELGELSRIERIVKVTGYIASAPGFTQQPAVLDGASGLLLDVFGEAGRHARSAVGAAELPLGAPVEIELIVRIRA